MTRMGRVEEFKFPEGKIHYRKFAKRCTITPNPFTGQEPLTPLAGQGVWFPQAIKKLRLLSLRAKRSNLLADGGIASPPAAARNVTVENFYRNKDGDG
jgi:hypothetical protein